MRGNRVSREVREEICRSYCRGVSVTDLVCKYNLAEVTIRRYLRDSGLLRRGTEGVGFELTEGVDRVEMTREQKVVYCNRVYGVGCWRFLSKEGFMDYMLTHRGGWR